MSMRPARQSFSVLFLAVFLFLTFLGGLAHARTYDIEETRFLQLINDYRAQHGLGALKLSGIVSEAAARHSLDMGTYGFFSHTTEHSSYFPARLLALGSYGDHGLSRLRRDGREHRGGAADGSGGVRRLAQLLRAQHEHAAFCSSG